MDELGPCNSFGRGLNLQELAYIYMYSWQRPRSRTAGHGQEGHLTTLEGCTSPDSFKFFREGDRELVLQHKSHRSHLIYHVWPSRAGVSDLQMMDVNRA